MSIEVNSKALRNSEDEVRKLLKKLGSICSSLQSIRKSLDSDIKNTGNIDRCFKNICEEMDQNEKNLSNVAEFLSDTAKTYEDAEKKIKKDLNGISNKKSSGNIISKILDKIRSIGEKVRAIFKILGWMKFITSPIGPIIILISVKKYFDEKGIAIDNEDIQEIEVKKVDIPELKEILSYDPGTYKEEVLMLQKRLNELEENDALKIKEDGFFGKETLAAVNRYKEKHGLWNFGEYEGKVGPTTWEHLFNNQKVPQAVEKEIAINEQDLKTSYIDIDKARDIARSITAWYESSSGKYVAGNFDGAGMSIGYFQWNLGSGTLQPLLREMIYEYGDEFDKIFDFIDPKTGKKASLVLKEILENYTTGQQVNWANSISDPNNKRKLIPAWQEAFLKLTENSNFVNIQNKHALDYYKDAEIILDWMEELGIKPTTRAYALALDIAIQNGTGVFTAVDHDSKIHRKWCWDIRNLVIDTINGKETFLTNPDAYTVYSDNSRDYDPVAKTCSKNQYDIAKEMMAYVEKCTDENTKKLYYIAAAAAISEFNKDDFIKDVWGRKSIIVNGSGYIRKVNVNFDSMFGLNDDLIRESANNVTIVTPKPSEAKPTEAPSHYSTNEKVQYYLSQLGFDIGKTKTGEPLIDGKIGFSTQAAILIYQYSQNLPITGQADAATLAALEASAKAGKTIADKSVFADFVPQPTKLGDPGGKSINVDNRKEAEPSDLINVGGHKLQKEAAVAWSYLITAARKDGMATGNILTISSGYRSVEEQKQIWNNALEKYGSPEVAANYAARPGKSEHQTGYAIDFVMSKSLTKENIPYLAKTPEFKWLSENANKFGFYNYPVEPWHWSYNPPRQ